MSRRYVNSRSPGGDEVVDVQLGGHVLEEILHRPGLIAGHVLLALGLQSVVERRPAPPQLLLFLRREARLELSLLGEVAAVAVVYTSGTTGKPKGAELTHSNLFVNCAFVVPRLIPSAADEHVAMATLPLFHSFGQTVVQNATLALGGTFTLLPRFDPQKVFEVMERDRVTVFAGVPTMYFALLHHEGGDRFDLGSLRYCMAGGAPMPVEVMVEFEKKFPVRILEGFGLSETSPIASFNVMDRGRKVGSIAYQSQIDDQFDPSRLTISCRYDTALAGIHSQFCSPSTPSLTSGSNELVRDVGGGVGGTPLKGRNCHEDPYRARVRVCLVIHGECCRSRRT